MIVQERSSPRRCSHLREKSAQSFIPACSLRRSCTFLTRISNWRLQGGGRRNRSGSASTHARPRPNPARSNLSLCALALAIVISPAAAEPATSTPKPVPLRFSLDGRIEGPAALFLVPLDRGYYNNEKLDVTVDDAATFLEPITRVASGSHDMGFADINALIRYRDQNPVRAVRAVFMVYNQPPLCDRRPQEPRHQRPEEPGRQAAWARHPRRPRFRSGRCSRG